MPDSKWIAPPDMNNEIEFKEYILDMHHKFFGIGNTNGIPDPAIDPGDSTATTVADLVIDFNELLTNLRTAGYIE